MLFYLQCRRKKIVFFPSNTIFFLSDFEDLQYSKEKKNLKLVTADTDLLKKCKAAISLNEMK